MSIPWTLHRYIFREMGKTFVLTAAALTGVLGLGGGVMQMVGMGAVTPGQLLQLMGIVLPVAGALTLPIAALYSATSTYGRLSADNELTACRGSGINLHLLLLPAVLLSLVSASITFGFINFIIPRMVRNLSEIVQSNIGALVEQRLHRPRGLKLSNYRIFADELLADANRDDQVVLGRVAFVETRGEEWTRYGTAQSVNLAFDRREDRVLATARMSGLTLFDRNEGTFSEVGELDVAAPEVPSGFRFEIKFLTLGQLLHYWSRPEEWPPVAEAVERLRSEIARSRIHQLLMEDWNADQVLSLATEGKSFSIRAERAAAIADDGGVELGGVVVTERSNERERVHRAKRAVLEAERQKSGASGGIRIELYEAEVSDAARTINHGRETLGPADVPRAWIENIAGMSSDQLIAQPSGTSAEKRRKDAVNWIGGTARRIAATMTERATFSASVLVLVVLGAVLGIVFRGSQPIVAFGIGFVPSLFVIILIVTGKQLAQNAGTHFVGLATMWLGIAVVAALDWWTLTRVLRR